MSINDAQNTRTSLAAISDGKGAFCIRPTQIRAPQQGEVRVKMQAAGICHTDYASLNWAGPLVMGHEGAGIVEAVGAGVDNVKVGQRVLLNWAIPCGQCAQCQQQHGNLCERTHGIAPELGSSRAAAHHTLLDNIDIQRAFNLGTFSEYALVRHQALTLIPDNIASEHACILGCGVMTGVGAVINSAQVKVGETVAVCGCGGVGLSVIQGAKIAGAAQIIAIDKRQASLDRAMAAGATKTLLMDDDADALTKIIDSIKALTNNRMVDHAFEATGLISTAFLPLKLVRNGGNAVQVSGFQADAHVPMIDFWWDKKYLVPLYGGCHPTRDFPKLFNWAQSGQLQLNNLVSKTYRLQELPNAMQAMLDGTVANGVILF